jgi:hypothetical protein
MCESYHHTSDPKVHTIGPVHGPAIVRHRVHSRRDGLASALTIQEPLNLSKAPLHYRRATLREYIITIT